MRKIYLATLTFTLIIALPVSSMAEGVDEPTVTETVETSATPALQKDRTEVIEKAQERKEKAVQKRQEIQDEIKTRREAAKEKFAQRREEFKTKLKEITDEKKQQIVERIDTRITKINERITGRLAEHLDRISGIIDRIETKASGIEGDTKTVDDAVVVARAAVETAQTAVSDQAGKEYVIEITDEGNLRDDVKVVVTQFRTDIKATVETVREARKKTVDAARALGQAHGSVIKKTQEATKSGMTDELGG